MPIERPADKTPWYTETEAAAYLRVSRSTLDRYVASGKLRVHRTPSNAPRYHRDDLDAALGKVS